MSLPAGTVTFLFTDVERSTELLARLGAERYARALAEHRALLREAFAGHGGVEVDAQGDAFFVAFPRAGDAVGAARWAQSALAEGPISVRMGIHTGEPLAIDSGYVGMDVHRAARIAAAAHGGQILLSRATRDLLPDADVVDLGDHRLKDLTRPERIYQLGLEEYPPLKSLNRSTLPEAAHRLVGRGEEQRELAELIRTYRLVTITGPGGTGKTRLALQLAGELFDEYEGGACFVQLASLSDPGLVMPVALEALNARDGPAGVERRCLLVLDNFEHVVDAAPAVAEFVARTPSATLLVTSRTPLHLSMEIEYPLDTLHHRAAVEMFLDRARAVRRHAEPSAAVDEICRRLDGLPLALELAAARLKLLDPPSLLARLETRLPLLTRGPSDVPERQRTLEATIQWSYGLLDDDMRRLLAALSVFSGSFDVDAAEAVVGADLDGLATLVDASLVKSRGDSRFVMLETIREFARNRLADEDVETLPRRHAAYFLRLAEAAAPELRGPDAAAWFDRLEKDSDNLRTVLDWYALVEPAVLARLTIALWRFWLVRGRFEEGQIAIERAIAGEATRAERALLTYQLGSLVISRGATARSRELFEEALELFRSECDGEGEARALAALGHAAADAGEWAHAIARYEAATELLRRQGNRLAVGAALSDRATVHLRSGDPQQALPLALEALELQREHGNQQGESLALATAGYAYAATGRRSEGHELLVESAKTAHSLGYLHGLLFGLNGLALVAYENGDVPRAAEIFAGADALRARLGIVHDPDEALVAHARENAYAAAPQPQPADELDLDAAVAAAIADS
jgi:predicted ATPase/class 3 adenylate cyclase